MSILVQNCQQLLEAYKSGKLGQIKMPEDSNPGKFETDDLRIAYFSLPMALNYQRDSYKLWEAALKTYQDPETKWVFNVSQVATLPLSELAKALLKHRLALQPNKHPETWQKIAQTVTVNFGSFSNLINKSDHDFLKLRELIQVTNKKGFPYLSGPKIFHYWSFILQEYGDVRLKNADYIEIAPDTHITQCSVKLGVISKEESESLTKEQISEKWRALLKGSKINPIDMHPPLWFWSRNGFIYNIK